MKNKSRTFLFLSLIPFSFSCLGCQNNPDEPVDPPALPEEVYDEEEDFIEGIDVKDLSQLKAAADKIGCNYTTYNRHFFNDDALSYYYINYKQNLPSITNNLVNEKYTYLYAEDKKFNNVEPYNSVYYQKDDDIYSANLGNDGIDELLKKENFDYSGKLFLKNNSVKDLYFNLSKFDTSYIEENEFVRISENKYESRKNNVIADFINIIIPNLKNDGFYMTFERITIELDEDNKDIFRIRLYCKQTQIGKLIMNCKDLTKPNWYLLFAEATLKDIGNTRIPCLEK